MSWWFKILTFLTVSLLLIGFYLIRIRSIKRQNRILEEEVKTRTLSLKDANEQLVHKQAELEKLNQTKDRFFSIIAHDLKNPVSAMALLTDMLKSEFKDIVHPGQKDLIQHVAKSSKRIKDLVLNLLEWAKTQSVSIRVEKKNILLIDVFREVIQVHEEQGRQKEITITAEISSNCYVTGDKNMISTMVRNIVSNSIKYTPRGGTIKLYATINAGKVKIAIEDTGIGMPQEILTKLLDLDKNISRKGTEEEIGTGLGMIICHEFAKLNGARIFAESEVDKGSTFYLEIPGGMHLETELAEETSTVVSSSVNLQQQIENNPVTEKSDPETREETIQEEESYIENGKETYPLVLIAEDTPELMEAIEKVLAGKFRILKAVDGLEAIKLATRNLPDLIVTDIMMPGMDGIGLCAKIKKDFNTCHIPVVMLTSLNTDEDKLKGIDTGADDYITKPFNAKILLSRVVNLIESRRMLQKRFIIDMKTIPEDVAVTSMDEKFMKEAVSVVEKFIEDPEFGVEIFSQEMNMSDSSLYRKLKALTSQSPNQFIRTLRLKRAAQLLEASQFNVAEVCYKVGFSDVKYFRQCFQKQFGMNPGEKIKFK